MEEMRMKTSQLTARITQKDVQAMKRLTKVNIAYKMTKIFKDHIGRDNAVSHHVLFRRVFGKSDTGHLADELRWFYAKQAMHFLRQRTKCFIGSKYENGTWKYFVIKDFDDAKHYVDILDNNIKRMRAMQHKAVKAARDQWYKLDWENDRALETASTKSLAYKK
jgi:hypothetical protein